MALRAKAAFSKMVIGDIISTKLMFHMIIIRKSTGIMIMNKLKILTTNIYSQPI
jgi:hypothetical protein